MDLDKYLRKAQKLEESRKETIRFSVSEEEFEFNKLDEEKYDEVYGRITAANTSGETSGLLTICRDIIFYSIADFRDNENFETMKEALQVEYPKDVVNKIFSISEIDKIGSELIKWNGMAENDNIKKV